MTRSEIGKALELFESGDLDRAINLLQPYSQSPIVMERCYRCGEIILKATDKDGRGVLCDPIVTEVLTTEGYKKDGLVLHFANLCSKAEDWEFGGRRVG